MKKAILGLSFGVVLLSGCASNMDAYPTLQGPQIQVVKSEIEGVYQCVVKNSHWTLDRHVHRAHIGVGNIQDRSGAVDDNEGMVSSQGLSEMVYASLGKYPKNVEMIELRDLSGINYRLSMVDAGALDKRTVYPRNLLDQGLEDLTYYVTGALTEVDRAVYSSGLAAGIDGFYGGGRVFVWTLTVDLRLVNAHTGVVEKTTSYTRQIVGEEFRAGVFRFFGGGSVAVDADLGWKVQQPLHAATRGLIDMAVADLVYSQVSTGSFDQCTEAYWNPEPLVPEEVHHSELE